MNNPIRFSDPTGHYFDEGCGSGQSCELPPIIEDPDDEKGGGGPSAGTACQGPNPSVVCLPTQTPQPTLPPIPPPADCSISGQYISVVGYTPPGCHFDHLERNIDWAGIDWWNVGVNAFELSGQGALFIGFIGVIGIGPASGYYGVTQVVGFAYDVYTLDEGAITWNVVSTVFNKFDFLPVVDAITNIYNIGEEFGDSIIYTPIYEPDITYPYPPIPMP